MTKKNIQVALRALGGRQHSRLRDGAGSMMSQAEGHRGPRDSAG
jgi:hypothetical protein